VFKQAIWLSATVMALRSLSAHSSEQAYAIEPTRTVVTFEVHSVGLTKNQAKHQGVFNAVTGTVMLDPQVGNGSLDIHISARSVQTGEAAIQTFVQGKGFLDVEEHAEIEYKAEHVLFVGQIPTRVDGELTLLGVTRAVPLTISRYSCRSGSASDSCVLDAVASFRRSEFGMDRYRAFVSDDVKLEIHSVTTALLARAS
jgi:polyisoprenoid-binding protein YceI